MSQKIKINEDEEKYINISFDVEEDNKTDDLSIIYFLLMYSENFYTLQNYIDEYKVSNFTIPPYYIKIGLSSVKRGYKTSTNTKYNNFYARMSNLQTGNPFIIEPIYIFCFEGDVDIYSIEKKIHKIAKKNYGALLIDKLKGGDEWFVFLDWKVFNMFITELVCRYLLLEVCEKKYLKKNKKFIFTLDYQKFSEYSSYTTDLYINNKIGEKKVFLFRYTDKTDNFSYKDYSEGVTILYDNNNKTENVSDFVKNFFKSPILQYHRDYVDEYERHVRYIYMVELEVTIKEYIRNTNEVFKLENI